MINIKATSKIKRGPSPRHTQSADEKLQSASQSKLFKKLSMSFYNWATKTNEKQVVCDDYNTSFDGDAKSEDSVTDHTSDKAHNKKKPSKKKPRKPKPEKPLVTDRPTNFNDYYFSGLPKNLGMPGHAKKSGKMPTEYSHYIEAPREVTEFYFRNVREGDASHTHKSISIQRSSRSEKKRQLKKPKQSTSRSKDSRIKGVARKPSQRDLKKPKKQ
jgi:hypothetical protein